MTPQAAQPDAATVPLMDGWTRVRTIRRDGSIVTELSGERVRANLGVEDFRAVRQALANACLMGAIRFVGTDPDDDDVLVFLQLVQQKEAS